MGIVINGEYFENFVFSDDPEKNKLMGMAYVREYELVNEYNELDAKYSEWVLDSCCPDYDGSVTREEGISWARRMDEIQEELGTLLDGTGITKEEYEAAKKNLT